MHRLEYGSRSSSNRIRNRVRNRSIGRSGITDTLRDFLRKSLSHAGEFLYPDSECPLCGFWGRGLCLPCRKSCREFGRFTLGEVEGYSLFHYMSVPEELIYEIKMKGSYFAMDAMKGLLGEYLVRDRERLSDYDTVTYIPSSDRKIRDRGFDLGRIMGIFIEEELGEGIRLIPYIRNRSTSEMKRMDLKERHEAVRQNFIPSDHMDGDYRGNNEERRIILFDDVTTSGASLLRGVDILTEEFGYRKENILLLTLLKKQNRD